MTPAVRLNRLTKTYTRGKQKVEVLHGVNLEIDAGEFVALMGPSGSGKTTLLNLIAGLDHADCGRDRSRRRPHRQALARRELANWRARNIGFVFQFYNLLPVLSAERNVEVPLLLTALCGKQRNQTRRAPPCNWWVSPIAPNTNRLSCRVVSNSAWRLRGRSSPTPHCWCATSRRVTWTGRAQKRSCSCCGRSIAIAARPSSWSRTIRGPPITHRASCMDKGSLVNDEASASHEVLSPDLGGTVAQEGPHDFHHAVDRRRVPVVRPSAGRQSGHEHGISKPERDRLYVQKALKTDCHWLI